ncbi:MAG: hypothetical protein HY056_14105 [Proteobacteria bacterium]|nr:hypothetical protein [Pseudomonadota bacterium]
MTTCLTRARSLHGVAAIATLVAGVTISVAGDVQLGGRVSVKCVMCHTFEPGRNKIGPSLSDIIGRKAGTAPGYSYSPDYVEAGKKGLVWSEENVIKYLPDPKRFLADYLGKREARSKMVFTLPNATERENVAAFLKARHSR